MFVTDPRVVEVLKVLRHLINYVKNGDVYGILDDTLVETAYDVLDHSELLKQFSTGVEDLMTENVLFTVYPQIREPFLGGVQNLSQIAQTTLLIEHLVCLAELVAVVASGTVCLENFAESLYLV